MAHQIVIAVVIIICAGLAIYAVDRPDAPFGPPFKWALVVLVVILAILGILWDFGIVA
jgi:hypothetical protein